MLKQVKICLVLGVGVKHLPQSSARSFIRINQFALGMLQIRGNESMYLKQYPSENG